MKLHQPAEANMTDAQWADLRQLEARTAWLLPRVRWSINWALRGPGWLPVRLRRVPLDVCCALLHFELWRVRHGA